MKMSAGGNKAKKKDLGAIVPCLSIFFGVPGGGEGVGHICLGLGYCCMNGTFEE